MRLISRSSLVLYFLSHIGAYAIFCSTSQNAQASQWIAQAKTSEKATADKLLNQCRDQLDQKLETLAISTCQKAAMAYEGINDLSGQAKAIVNLGLAHERVQDYQQAISKGKLALKILHSTNEQLPKALTLKLLERSYKAIGQLQESNFYGSQAQAFFKRQDEADRLKKEGSRYFQNNQIDLAIATWEEALEIYQEMGDSQFSAKTLTLIGVAHKQLGDFNSALENTQKALLSIRMIRDIPQEYSILILISTTYRMLGQENEAKRYYQQSLTFAKENNRKDFQIQSLKSLIPFYLKENNNEQTIILSTDLLKLARENNLPADQVVALNYLATAYTRVPNYEKALEIAQEALTIVRRIKDYDRETFTLGILVSIYSVIGDNNKAIDLSQRMIDIFQRTSNEQGEILSLIELSATQTVASRYQEAIENANLAWEKVQGKGQVELEIRILTALINPHRGLNNFRKALDYAKMKYVKSTEVREAHPELEVEALQGLAELYRLLGDEQKYVDYSQKAIDLQQRIDLQDSSSER